MATDFTDTEHLVAQLIGQSDYMNAIQLIDELASKGGVVTPNLVTFRQFAWQNLKESRQAGGDAPQRGGGQAIPVGGGGEEKEKSTLKLTPVETKLTFNDLAGLKREKAEILERFIYPLQYNEVLPQGSAMLLFGIGGTGKSSIAKAITQEYEFKLGGPKVAKVFLFVGTGAEIKGRYVGQTEKSLKRFFETANKTAIEAMKNHKFKHAKSIVFIDELDAIAGRRGDGDPHMTSSVNALLQLLDGVISYNHVVFMGATNLPWVLDPAILRRFTTKIFVDLPSDKGRAELIYNKLTKSQIVNNKGVNQAKLNNMITSMMQLTGFKKYGDGATESLPSYIINYLGKEAGEDAKKMAEERADRFMVEGGHDEYKKALFKFGVSPSDLDKILDAWISRLAIKKLQQPYRLPGGAECYPIVPADCNPKDCKSCDSDNVNQKELQVTLEELVADYDRPRDSEFQQAIRSFGTNVDETDYVWLVMYYLTGKSMYELEPN